MDINYKKGDFAIIKNIDGKTISETVSGYHAIVDGVNCGLFVHRNADIDAWTISDVSTGCRIAYGETRRQAIEKTDLDRIFKYRRTPAYKWNVLRFITACAKCGVTADFSGHWDVVMLSAVWDRKSGGLKNVC